MADKRGALVYSDDFGTAIEIRFGKEARHYPFTLTYLVNLSDRPFTDKWVVPATIRALIMWITWKILIASNNTERKRRMSIAPIK
ncbi:hypothetical protein O3W44_22850 [Pantoea sp. LMR881]|uniref:hypothetical protein n=1 Tax=Pantoea sp. LMR881 TaxID=3014336 RepID=UPI0022B011C9|nr:hypothetical protein [Pantoea sp. LMR881]MCZ4061372.1 hypothetical protein [Pantoea sp. LMR881]